MLRKIRRSVARTNLKNQEIPIFGKYAPVNMMVRNKKTGKQHEVQRQRSYFARVWRSWL